MKIRFALLSVLPMLLATGLQAQDFEYVRDTSPFLTSSNAAGLGRLGEGKTAQATVSFLKDDGSLVGLDASSDSWKAGAQTQAYARISDRMAFWGKLSYSYFSGKEMGGYLFMDPLDNPFNFLEASTETVGTKNREMYSLAAGMAYSLGEKWTLGLKADYDAGNYVKTKDPRYRDELMDLNLSAGVEFRPSELLSFGVSALWRSRIESIMAHLYGTTDKQYVSWTDFGSFLGTSAAVDGDESPLPSSTRRPMADTYYGAALQFEIGRKARIYNEFTFLLRDGYYGIKSSTSPMFYEYGGSVFGYDGTLMLPLGGNVHKIALSAQYRPLDSFKNIYRYVTEAGKSTVVKYEDQERTLARRDFSLGASYDAYMGLGGVRPLLQAGARASLFSRRQTSQVYPYWRKSSLVQIDAEAYAQKNFISGSNVFGLGLKALFHTGSGTKADDGKFDVQTTVSAKSFDDCLDLQYEYDTAMRAGAQFSFSYTRVFSESLSAFVQLSEGYVSLLQEPQYLAGRGRNSAFLTIGLNF